MPVTLPNTNRAKTRILVADDECLLADLMAVILNHHGYEAVAVYGGRQAVETASYWNPDFFLSDLSMPGTDGVQAAIEICEVLPECIVLLLSAELEMSERIHEGRLRGLPLHMLRKPISPADVIERIRDFAAA